MIRHNRDRSRAGTIARGRGLSPVKTAAVLTALLALCGGLAGCATVPVGPQFTSGPLPTEDTDTTKLPATVPATAAPTELPTDTPSDGPAVTEAPTATTAPAVNELFIGSNNPAALALIAGLAEPERVIMTPEQIAADNARMLRECNKLTDLAAMPDTLSREELQARLNAAKLPALPKYDKTGRAITQEEFDAICALRNIDAAAEQYNLTSGIPFTLSLSIGAVFTTSEERKPLDECIRAADSLMYRNKQKKKAARKAGQLFPDNPE